MVRYLAPDSAAKAAGTAGVVGLEVRGEQVCGQPAAQAEERACVAAEALPVAVTRGRASAAAASAAAVRSERNRDIEPAFLRVDTVGAGPRGADAMGETPCAY